MSKAQNLKNQERESSFIRSSTMRTAAAGAASMAVGIGLARFAFIVVMPALSAVGLFSPGQAASAGAANLVGYLLGAWAAPAAARRFTPGTLIRWSAAAATAGFFACAATWDDPTLNYLWLLSWRLIGGVAGATAMALTAPAVLASTPVERRGRAGGVVFAGIGLGVVVAGPAAPALAPYGLAAVWIGLGVVSLALTAAAWPVWGGEEFNPASSRGASSRGASSPPAALPPATGSAAENALWSGPRGRAPALLAAIYALDAVGYVPHTVFWVDHLVRGLQWSLADGGASWAAFGVGAMIGAPVAGATADRLGFRRTLTGALALKGCAAAAPLMGTAPALLIASSFLMGALTPGVVALTSGAALEIVGRDAHRRAWSRLTLWFACWQAAGAAALAYAAQRSGGYEPAFAAAAVALAAAAAASVLLHSHRPQPEEAAA